jgi:hypothetical protein
MGTAFHLLGVFPSLFGRLQLAHDETTDNVHPLNSTASFFLACRSFYSYRSESTGLARAARTAWKTTVDKAMRRVSVPVKRNTPNLIGRR